MFYINPKKAPGSQMPANPIRTVENILDFYAPKIRGVVPLEETEANHNKFWFTQELLGSKATYQIYIDGVASASLNEQDVARAIVLGFPYLPYLLDKVGMHAESAIVAAAKPSTALPDVWSTIKLTHGVLSLYKQDGGADFELQLRIKQTGKPPISWKGLIDKALVAKSVGDGQLPIFDAMASVPVLLDLLLTHDDALVAANFRDEMRDLIDPVKHGENKKPKHGGP